MVGKVITEVVEQDLCIGCGVCTQACSSNALTMKWDSNGFRVADVNEDLCVGDGECIKVCPFNPAASDDEDSLANIFLAESKNTNPKIGHYETIRAGYSNHYRKTSSSGGIATYIYDYLFRNNLIDYVVTVGSSSNSDAYYDYKIVSSVDELLSISKTRYYPVTLSEVMKDIKKLKGRFVVSGVGCFIKAIRLAQKNDPEFREKIVFTVGIICGGVKSSFFTEYLASKAGVSYVNVAAPEYRIKDENSTAGDYSFGCMDKSEKESENPKLIKMKDVGDMWGTGLFKANACDLCDDVTTELADISLGDAWIDPYRKDGLGTSVVVTRSSLAEEAIVSGIESGDLFMEDMSVDKFILSQKGSFNHRHDGLSSRIKIMGNLKKIPVKRKIGNRVPIGMLNLQKKRMLSREQSIILWKKVRNSKDFDEGMKKTLSSLKLATRISKRIKSLEKMFGVK